MAGLLSRERTVAGPGFNRWLVPPAALAIHLSIGMAYGFSVFWLPLSRAIGVTKPVPVNPRKYRNFVRGDLLVSAAVWSAFLIFAHGLHQQPRRLLRVLLLGVGSAGDRSDEVFVRLGEIAAVGAAPVTTIVTSPRTPSPAQATSSPSGPRRTSSWVLVSSRHTAAGRSSPIAAAIAVSAAAVRCGASKKTMVRRSPESSARCLERSPAFRGRKPSKVKRSVTATRAPSS
mgnify:CR=1 FL=1